MICMTTLTPMLVLLHLPLYLLTNMDVEVVRWVYKITKQKVSPSYIFIDF